MEGFHYFQLLQQIFKLSIVLRLPWVLFVYNLKSPHNNIGCILSYYFIQPLDVFEEIGSIII